MRDLNDILLEWEERREGGEADCLDELCAAYPEMEGELRDRARYLLAAEALLTVGDADTGDDAPTPAETALPARLAGFEIRGVLGHGGMGVVYSGWDARLARPVAIKMVHSSWPPWLIADREHLDRRFHQEAQLLAKLKHPHIVPVYATATEGEQTCLVMEQLKGGSLADHQQQLTGGPIEAILIFMEKVARAVHYAHEHHILHRDLKPANILLDAAGEPLVSDFGLAKIATDPVEGEGNEPSAACAHGVSAPALSSMTGTGQLPGTPAYMAPEQFDPGKGVPSPATDVWALGVILYELLAGQRPFEGKDREEMARAVLTKPPRALHELAPRVGRKLEGIVKHCLTIEPEARLANAQYLADALASLRQRRFTAPRLLALGLILLLSLSVVVLAYQRIVTRRLTAVATAIDPHEEYLAATAPLVDRLKLEGTIELIGGGDNHDTFFHCYDPGTLVVPTDKGLRVTGPFWGGFVELLPRVPFPEYRIRAHILPSSWMDRDPGFGLYVQAEHAATSWGKYTFYNLLHIYPEKPPATTATPAPWAYVVVLSAHYHGVPKKAEENLRRQTYILPQAAFPRRQVLQTAAADTWISLNIEVRSQGVSAVCSDPEGNVSPKPLPASSRRDFPVMMRKRFSDLSEIPQFPGYGSALGIFLQDAVCTVGEFRVELISPP